MSSVMPSSSGVHAPTLSQDKTFCLELLQRDSRVMRKQEDVPILIPHREVGEQSKIVKGSLRSWRLSWGCALGTMDFACRHLGVIVSTQVEHNLCQGWSMCRRR